MLLDNSTLYEFKIELHSFQRPTYFCIRNLFLQIIYLRSREKKIVSLIPFEVFNELEDVTAQRTNHYA